jgi:two-component sensor histidine kinase/ABC-type amino acid transport substrate-binding protein
MQRALLPLLFTILLFSFSTARAEAIDSSLFDRPLIARGDFDYPPFEFIDSDGMATGFNVELLEAVADVLGLWSLVTGELASGEVDLITGMFLTEEREQLFDFSTAHNVISHAIYTRKGSDISRPSDLIGKTVYVQSGDVMDEFLRNRIPSAKVIEKPTYRDFLIALDGGKEADAALAGRLQAELIIRQEKLSGIEAVGSPLFPRRYCFAVQKGNSDLIAVLNDGLAILRENGTYDKIYSKWFGTFDRQGPSLPSFRTMMILFLLLFSAAALVLFLIWNLRRTVKQKTSQLEEELSERKAAEWRFRNVFEGVPVSIWEEDISLVRNRIEELREAGVSDFKVYAEKHPEIISWMVEHIKIIDINPATLLMFETDSREELLGSFSKVDTKHVTPFLVQEFVAIAEGKEYIQDETLTLTFKGNEKVFLTTIYIPRSGTSGLSHMLVSMVDITGLKTAERKLAKSLADKDTIMKELHHRVKNNMQLMSSLINLQSQSIEDEKLSQIIRTSENRIRAMALIHELLYQTDEFASIELDNYLPTLARTIMESFTEGTGTKISLTLTADPITVSIDTAIPCGLIVNEIINNSMEHAFPGERSGQIFLNARLQNGGIIIEAGDDGTGMKPEAAGKKQKSGHKSMGLTLIDALSSQLNGTLKKKSAPESGTLYTLHLGPEHLL